jgi:hypothetical protein
VEESDAEEQVEETTKKLKGTSRASTKSAKVKEEIVDSGRRRSGRGRP